ncbi:hypothetical protein PoB_007371300 [Plakobranchus ocellatus]|uniref:Secreted protein n=1 Tax=Plakobranchus ocellatus TaxID=259542 RepID=A0AAV4DSC4_9GAST|nr:hypothetical protein PoB_007371300 [Plakobranchus ocellatus]
MTVASRYVIQVFVAFLCTTVEGPDMKIGVWKTAIISLQQNFRSLQLPCLTPPEPLLAPVMWESPQGQAGADGRLAAINGLTQSWGKQTAKSLCLLARERRQTVALEAKRGRSEP